MHNPAVPPSDPLPVRSRLLKHAGWPFFVALVGLVWVGCAAGESLWLDELHTSWTVSGAWGEVAARARQGNQSPLFFYGLFGLARTLGNLGGISSELLLRLPSIVCWGAALFACLRISQQSWVHPLREAKRITGWRFVASQPRLAMGVAIVVWLLLDRIQLFYATEARVYAAVQLISLLAWCCVGRLAMCESPQALSRSVLMWCVLSVLLISLHLTAVLACVWQIACGTWIVYKRHPQLRMAWTVAVTIVLLVLVVALQLSSQVWEHRQQWASFAGDASWSALIGLFPLVAYSIPVVVARGGDWLCSLGPFVKPRGHRPARSGASRSSLLTRFSDRLDANREHESNFPDWLWWIAAAGPWLSAWCITSLGIAPVFHRRFVIVAAIPLVLVAATQLARIRRPGLRWLAVIGVAGWLIVSQGTLDNWRAGSWYGWQRSEGWRQASQFLQAHAKPNDAVWCCSGLIEASGAELPLSESLNRYLSFPLRGVYRVLDSQGQPLEPRALIGNGDSWRAQLLVASGLNHSGFDEQQGGAGESAAVSFPAGQLLTGDQWIVYRGSPASFNRQLRLMQRAREGGPLASWQIGWPRSFGLVSVVRISRAGGSDGLLTPSRPTKTPLN